MESCARKGGAANPAPLEYYKQVCGSFREAAQAGGRWLLPIFIPPVRDSLVCLTALSLECAYSVTLSPMRALLLVYILCNCPCNSTLLSPRAHMARVITGILFTCTRKIYLKLTLEMALCCLIL